MPKHYCQNSLRPASAWSRGDTDAADCIIDLCHPNPQPRFISRVLQPLAGACRFEGSWKTKKGEGWSRWRTKEKRHNLERSRFIKGGPRRAQISSSDKPRLYHLLVMQFWVGPLNFSELSFRIQNGLAIGLKMQCVPTKPMAPVTQSNISTPGHQKRQSKLQGASHYWINDIY